MPRLWYVRTQDGERGPFPAGAIIADRLIGRIRDGHELSYDRQDWRAFDAWPELVALSHAGDAPVDTQPEWAAERAKARLRWVDERSHSDRRASDDSTAVERRESRAERRAAGHNGPGTERSKPRVRMGLMGEAAVLKLLLALVLCAALLALLVYLYGPVNPVAVRIH